MSLTEMEQQTLKAVAALDGQATNKAVGERIGTSIEDALFLCIKLVKRDYVVFKPNRGFSVTPAGKEALDGSGAGLSRPAGDATGQPAHFREGSSWKAVGRGRGGFGRRPSFAKPGQEPDLWNTVKMSGAGKSSAAGAVKTWAPGPVELLYEGTLLCSFCAGKGQRPVPTKCPVCRGTGAITLKPPVAVCAFCKGRGSKEPRNYVTCLICRGRGYVEVEEGALQCATCRGTGKEKGSNLYCGACKGKGVVKPVSDAGKSKKKRVSPTATELEVLTAYCEAEEAGEAPNIPRRTHLTHAYVDMLRKKLCDKGLLASVGSRQYRATDLGREKVALAKSKRREKAIHGS